MRHDVTKDLKELAMQLTNDPDHKFDLSLQLDDLDTAVDIVRSVPENEAESKWKALGDRALLVWRFDLAREAFERANDLSALMLLLLSTGDREGLQRLAVTAGELFWAYSVCFDGDVSFQSETGRTTWRLRHFSSWVIPRGVWTC